jgi:hypothetical protein
MPAGFPHRLSAAGSRDYQLRSYLVCQSERRRSALMLALQPIAAGICAMETVDA